MCAFVRFLRNFAIVIKNDVMTTDKPFTSGSFTPLYKQFTDYVKSCIRSGRFERGKALPSIHSMVMRTGISRETIVKGYADLCREGVLVSHKGKGYFVKESYITGIKSVMVFMDKMSPHQQDIMDGLITAVGSNAEITIRMHYQNPQWFVLALEASLDLYDWYILFPHFPLDDDTRQKVGSLIGKIPPEKLIILDHLPELAPAACGAVFQSIEEDVPGALEQALPDVRRFSKLRYASLSISLYGDIVAKVISGFGKRNGVPVEILTELPEKVSKGDLFFVSGSRLDRKLSVLLKAISASGLVPGKDVGLICYNDFPLNEFIFGGLTTLSVDFREMGRLAGEMILKGTLSKIQCFASLIRRRTF